MYLKLIPDNTNFLFTKLRFIAFAVSATLMVASMALLFTLGLNFGVDFRGGAMIEVADSEPIDIGEVRSAVSALNLGSANVQEIQDVTGGKKGVVVFLEKQSAGGEGQEDELAQQKASEQVQAALRELLSEDIDFRRIDVVGPTVSGELIQRGAMAVILAIAMMLVYIWFRFEWQFSLGAIIALIHDVALTMGMFAVTQLEFNLSIIAAILTIVGYSMNDTVVVYDRVRENLRKYKKKPLQELLDLSINETLSRTVMTSVTTLMALVSLYILGGEVLRGFTFAMIWGVVIGTYSSIFVASPMLLMTGVKRDWSKQSVTATA